MTAAQFNLPTWIEAKLNSCPKSPLGCHQFLFNVSRHLLRYLSPEQTAILLAEAVYGCGREVTAKEITQAVQSAAKTLKPST